MYKPPYFDNCWGGGLVLIWRKLVCEKFSLWQHSSFAFLMAILLVPYVIRKHFDWQKQKVEKLYSIGNTFKAGKVFFKKRNRKYQRGCYQDLDYSQLLPISEYYAQFFSLMPIFVWKNIQVARTKTMKKAVLGFGI